MNLEQWFEFSANPSDSFNFGIFQGKAFHGQEASSLASLKGVKVVCIAQAAAVGEFQTHAFEAIIVPTSNASLARALVGNFRASISN